MDDVRPSATELATQQNAIQHETDLADESPEAQAIQEAKSEVDSNNKTSTTHIDSEKKNLLLKKLQLLKRQLKKKHAIMI